MYNGSIDDCDYGLETDGSMKALILSCNTGTGHNACAAAVREAMLARGVPCDVRDGLGFVSGLVSRAVSAGHVCFYRYLPGLYGRAYRLAERRVKTDGGDSATFRFMGLGAKRLRACIERGGYTHVICTHLFPAMMLTGMQRRDPLPIRTAFIATDYTASPGYECVGLDWCFVPEPGLIPRFVRPDMPAERIVGCGIPVRRDFQGAGDRVAARQALGLDPDRRHLLVMSGSMGCGPLAQALEQLKARLSDSVEISVICGTNRRLYRQLDRRFGGVENIHLHGMVEHISPFMDSADLYLTKPGGLSVSEALSKGLPMVLLMAVEGCETYNMRYCVELGAAKAARTAPEAAGVCAALLRDDAALEAMRRSMAGLFQPPAAEVVCDRLLQTGAAK